MIKISVIMPVYNSEIFLPAAIESVLNQSLGDIELILLDDGSTDGSGSICDKYASKNNKVKAIHQNNQGITKTRNIGLSYAEGEYIAFIDNDDAFDIAILEKAYNEAVRYNADIVKFGFAVEESFGNGTVNTRVRASTKKMIIEENQAEVLEAVRETGYFSAIWNGIYKRKFINEQRIKFNETITNGYEDWTFNFLCFPAAKTQVVLPDTGYYYYQRDSHSTFKKFHPNQIRGIIYALESEYNMYNILGKDLAEDWNKRVTDYIIEILMIFQRKGCRWGIKEKKAYLEEIYQKKQIGNFCPLWKSDIPASKQMVGKLFYEKRMKSLLIISKIYYKYIVYKKGRKA